MAFQLFQARLLQNAVKNVIRIASVAFIIFFIQDFVSFPVTSVIILRGITITMGLVFYAFFSWRLALDGKNFQFEKFVFFYWCIIEAYGAVRSFACLGIAV